MGYRFRKFYARNSYSNQQAAFKMSSVPGNRGTRERERDTHTHREREREKIVTAYILFDKLKVSLYVFFNILRGRWALDI